MTMSGSSFALREGLVDAAAARETLLIGDDRKLGDRLERQLLLGLERVTGRHDDAMMPGIIGKRREFRHILQRLGRDADVGCPLEQHRHDLGRARFVQDKMDLRKLLLEFASPPSAAHSAPAYASSRR